MTDNGFNCASQCMQRLRRPRLHPRQRMEQLVRDARINMIYEGTNGIQSLDLLAARC